MSGNLSVPVVASTAVGQIITNAFWTANVTNALQFLIAPPIATLIQQTAQTFTGSGTFYPIAMDTTLIDTYGGHSNTTNNTRYTAQVDGYYLINSTAVFGSLASGYIYAALRLNGSSTVPGTELGGAAQPSGFYPTLSPAAVAYLNAGDYIELIMQASAVALKTAVTASGAYCCMLQAVWLHS